MFDFQKFIQELRDNPEKKEVVQKYEKQFGPIEWDIKDQKWYQEYICEFDTIDYLVPDETEDDFDWELLMQLVAWSFSSKGMLDMEDEKDKDDDDEKDKSGEDKQNDDQSEKKDISETDWQDDEVKLPEFVISVQSGDQSVVKKVSELWSFQILRLYEIYIEEQMNLAVLMAENEEEKQDIEAHRESRKQRWKLILEKFQKDKEQNIEKQKEQKQIQDLKDQL